MGSRLGRSPVIGWANRNHGRKLITLRCRTFTARMKTASQLMKGPLMPPSAMCPSTNNTHAHILMGFLALLIGCHSPLVIRSEAVQLVANTWTQVQTDDFRIQGPVGELCLDLDSSFEALPGSPGTLTGKKGAVLSIRAQVGGDSGPSIDLQRPFTVDAGGTKKLCFDQPHTGGGRKFDRIELLSTVSTTVQGVTWWSGKRRWGM